MSTRTRVEVRISIFLIFKISTFSRHGLQVVSLDPITGEVVECLPMVESQIVIRERPLMLMLWNQVSKGLQQSKVLAFDFPLFLQYSRSRDLQEMKFYTQRFLEPKCPDYELAWKPDTSQCSSMHYSTCHLKYTVLATRREISGSMVNTIRVKARKVLENHWRYRVLKILGPMYFISTE